MVAQGQWEMRVGLMLSSECTSSKNKSATLFISRAILISHLSLFHTIHSIHQIKSTEAAADESEAARAIAEAQKAAHEYETVTVGHHEHVQHVHTSTEV